MPSPIDRQLVQRAIRRGLAFTPSLSEGDLPNWIDDLDAVPNPADTEMLWSVIEDFGAFITEEAKEQLAECTIVIVPSRIFGGLADIHEGRQYIFLFEGLLNLIAAQQELSYMLADLPDELAEIFPNPDFPKTSVQHWAAVLSGRLIHGYTTRGEPLPDFSEMLVTPRAKNIHIGFISSVWWLLLHELGHHVKGHLEGDMTPIFPTCTADLLVDDELKPYQQAELEADAFVLDSLIPDARRFYLGWMSSAIYPQLMFDSMLTTRKDTHPLSVDRLEAARQRMQDDPYIGDDVVPEHLESTAESYINTEKSQHQLNSLQKNNYNPIADAKRQNVEEIIGKIATFYEPYGLDFNSVLLDKGHTWRRFADQTLDDYDPPSEIVKDSSQSSGSTSRGGGES